MASDLYHNRVLELAAEISHITPIDAPEAEVEKVSRICGSTVSLALRLSEDGTHVAEVSVNPKACALGQASTAILVNDIIGAPIEDVIAARDALKAMLKDGGPPPEGRFWELRHLQSVADYPQRHTSTLLAFDAAVAAIEKALENRSANEMS